MIKVSHLLLEYLLYFLFIKSVLTQYASIPKKLEIDEEGGYVGLVVGISNTVGPDYSLVKLIRNRYTFLPNLIL